MLFLVIKGDLNEEAFGFWFKSVFNYIKQPIVLRKTPNIVEASKEILKIQICIHGYWFKTDWVCLPLIQERIKSKNLFDHIYSLKIEAGIVDTFVSRSLKAIGTLINAKAINFLSIWLNWELALVQQPHFHVLQVFLDNHGFSLWYTWP